MKLGLVGRGAGRKIARPREWRRGVLIEVEEETGDVDDLQVSVVWVVIVAGKGKGFGGLCHVWSKSDVEEEENEVCGEGKVVGNESVQMVDGIVILESWIVVGVMAMLVGVGWQLAESKPR